MAPATTSRGKAQKASLRDLIQQGSLSNGQTLFLHDYRGKRSRDSQPQLGVTILSTRGDLLDVCLSEGIDAAAGIQE